MKFAGKRFEPAEGVTLSGAWFRWKLRMDRISGDIREDRRPKVQETWVTVCESLRRKDRECCKKRSVCCFVLRAQMIRALFLVLFYKKGIKKGLGVYKYSL